MLCEICCKFVVLIESDVDRRRTCDRRRRSWCNVSFSFY